MARRVQLWAFEDEKPVIRAVFFLRPDGLVGIDGADPVGVGFATSLVAAGIEGDGGKKLHLSDGQRFLDALKHHFRSRYTWVRDEPEPAPAPVSLY